MNASTLRRQRLMALAMILAFAAAMWFLVLSPRFDKPNAIQEEARVFIDKKALVDQSITSLERRQKYLAVAQQQVMGLTKRFPSQTDVPGLLAQVYQAASEAGLERNQVESVLTGDVAVVADPTAVAEAAKSEDTAAPAPAASGSQSATMTIEVNATGTSREMALFMARLQSMERAMAVESATLRALPLPNGSYGDRYTLKVIGKAFLLSDIPPVPDNLVQIAKPAEDTTK